MTAATPEPSFALCGPGERIFATGIAESFHDIADAQLALSAGGTPLVLGALPFDVSSPAALIVPQAIVAALPQWPTGPVPDAGVETMVPRPEEHRARVADAVQRLRAPAATLHKVVLARALRLRAEQPWDVNVILGRLIAANPGAYAYAADLSPAGGDYPGRMLVGASPELLVSRNGDRVTCKPFAGSAPRGPDPETDRANGAALAASAKDRHEHALVVDAMRKALDPLCVDLQIATAPELSHTDALWHLSTPITARLREKSTTSIDLALALHPTPAVGGVPAKAAAALIAELEGDRGFYAGAVGWCDAAGDGRWVVSIRCAELSADRREALAQSGGGIVAESDPDDEVAETTTKFRTILTGLGVST